MSNEAAERLRLEAADQLDNKVFLNDLLDEALAAEHKATVERIRAAVDAWAESYDWHEIASSDVPAILAAVLDAEAAR